MLWNPANLQSTNVNRYMLLALVQVIQEVKDLLGKSRLFRHTSGWSFAFQNGGILSSKGMLLTISVAFSFITSFVMDSAAWCISA